MDTGLIGQLLIRADGGSRIGAGHLMRCLALAQCWQAKGGKVTFLSHCDNDALRQRIVSAGINFIDLEKPYPDPLDLQIVEATLEKFKQGNDGKPLWLVLDGYHLDSTYQDAVRSSDNRLLVIDDTAHLTRYHTDILLNQNINAERLNYRCNPDALLLLGSRYALLRSEFLAWQGQRQRQTPEVARKILITLGGSDPDNITLKIIQALQQVDLPDLEVKVVIGPANPHLLRLQQAIEHSTGNLQLVTAAGNMPDLMAWADLAISSAGSTCWELAFMGVPSLLLILADNQRSVAFGMADAGAAILLGQGEEATPEKVAVLLVNLIRDRRRRARLAERAQALIDGNGAERIFLSITGFDNDK